MVWPLEMQIDDTVVCRIMMKPRADKLFCVFGLLNKMKISRYIILFSDKDQFLLVSWVFVWWMEHNIFMLKAMTRLYKVCKNCRLKFLQGLKFEKRFLSRICVCAFNSRHYCSRFAEMWCVSRNSFSWMMHVETG